MSKFRSLKHSISYPCHLEMCTISDITITTATTTAIGHTASREVGNMGGRYNRAVRGY